MDMEINGDKVIITCTCGKWVDEGRVMPISKRNRYFTITKPLFVSQYIWNIDGKSDYTFLIELHILKNN